MLLKLIQSVEERYPFVVELAGAMVTLPFENVRGAEKVVVAIHCGTPLFQVRT